MAGSGEARVRFGSAEHRRGNGRRRLAGGPRRAARSVRHGFEQLEDRRLLSIVTGLVPEASYLPPAHRLSSPGGYLSEPAAGTPLTVAMDYLCTHAADLGVTPADIRSSIVTDEYFSPEMGVTQIYLRQQSGGGDIVNADLNVNVAADNRILSVGSTFVPGVMAASRSLSADFAQPRLTAAQAVLSAGQALKVSAAATVELVMDSTAAIALGQTSVAATLSVSALSLDPIPARMVYVATAAGLAPSWNMVLRTPDGEHWYNVDVDSQSGKVLNADDWVDHAFYDVFARPTLSPTDGSRAIVSSPQDPAASPYGWHDTNGVSGADYTDTRGNNVFAQEDQDGNNTGGYRPDGGAALNFDFPLDLAQDPPAYQSAAITNLFYWNNLCHDIHYKYGFNEAAGNFQAMNYTGKGQGNDQVYADAQDGGWMNNADFATPPDGQSPRMQMYIWNMTTPNRDGDLESRIMVHEYGHGVSTRLVGGPDNSDGLNAQQSGGMGEGWSDYFALAITQTSGDLKTGAYPMGTYVLGQPNNGPGMRTYPYSFDKSIDPHTYDDYNNNSEVHGAGEIWCSALWDLNWLLIDKYGFSSNLAAGYTGTSSAGNILALQLVIDSLKLMPVYPTFLDGRDAILQADQALTGGANQQQIWEAFARRGMGYSADDGGSANAWPVTGATDLPPLRVVNQVPEGTVATAPGHIDFVFTKAIDPASVTVADDIQSFTGPGGVDVKSQITGVSFPTTGVLRVSFNPPATQGLYTMVIGPQILAADDHGPMDQNNNHTAGEATADQYTGSFRYDAVAMAVTSTAPATGSVLTVNVTPGVPTVPFKITFNEAYAQSSIGADDLVLSRGTVAGVQFTSANTVEYDLAGIDSETPLTVTLPAGAVTDLYDNPIAGLATDPTVAFTATFSVEIATAAFPTLQAQNPPGSMIYSGSTTAQIGSTSDTDSFIISLDAGQQLTAIVLPNATLQPAVSITGPGGATLGSATAAVVGNAAVLSAISVSAAGTYTVTVRSAGSTTGPYTLQLTLNAALESEDYGGGDNNSFATAQSLNSAFLPFGSAAARAAVLGTADTARETFASWNLSTNPGWSTTGQWAWGKPTGQGGQDIGNPDPTSGHTGENVYGVNLGGDYSATPGGPYYLTTSAIDCTNRAGTHLSFWRWLNSDDPPYVTATVEVSKDGKTWTTVYDNSSASATDSSWVRVDCDIHAVADNQPAVYVRWGYEVADWAYLASGWNIDDVSLTDNTAGGGDYYVLDLGAGQSATAAVTALEPGTVFIDLYDSQQNLVTRGAPAANVGQVINDFVAPVAGTYYLRVAGDGQPYSLLVTRAADFDTEPNDSVAAAQDISTLGAALGYVTAATPADNDAYRIHVTAGDSLTVSTQTPADGPNQFANVLDPKIALYDPTGQLVGSDDNGAIDGRNALLSYSQTVTGDYTVVVSAAAQSGEYLLSVQGATGSLPPFNVAGSAPANGQRLPASPPTFTVHFNDFVLAGSVQNSDLVVDTAPNATAVAPLLLDGKTVVFTLPVLAEGTHQITIAAGSMLDVQQTPLTAFSSTFVIDLTGPRITASSVSEGGTLGSGNSTYTVTFDEDMNTSLPLAASFSLVGAWSGTYTGGVYQWLDPRTCQLQLAGLLDDSYTLTLISGGAGFQDLVGNALDGEPHTPYALPSGDGHLGGDFVLHFQADMVIGPFPVPLKATEPLGSLVYTGSARAAINTPIDTDSFTIALDAGQALSAVVALPAGSTLRPTVTVLGPDGTVLQSVTSSVAGKQVFVQTVPIGAAGTYTVAIGSAGSTAGPYTLQLTLNATVEAELHDGPSNDTSPGQSIDGSFIALTPHATRAAVLGTTDINAGSLPYEIEPNDTTATASDASQNFGYYSGNLYHMGLSGTISSISDSDWYSLGALQAGDVLSVTQSGTSSMRGTLIDPFLYLYCVQNGTLTLVNWNDDDGPGTDSLIGQYAIPSAGTYFAVAFSWGDTGTYQLGLWLENAGAAPQTGGPIVKETEPNNDVNHPTDASASWRHVQYVSHTPGTITAGDADYYKYKFNAGDLVSVDVRPTGNTLWWPSVALVDSTGTVMALEDGTSTHSGTDSFLYSFVVPTQTPASNTWYLRVQSSYGSGTYAADVYLSSNTQPGMPTLVYDYYSVTLSAGDAIAVGLKDLGEEAAHVELQDNATHNWISATAGASNWDEMIPRYEVPSNGTYLLRVCGGTPADYSLVVTRNADLDAEPNDTATSAQTLHMVSTVGEAAALGEAIRGQYVAEPDEYTAGDALTSVVSGLTLSAQGDSAAVTSQASTAASTGDRVFAHGREVTWSGNTWFEADFAAPASSVSIDMVPNSSGDYGYLFAYNAAGQLVQWASSSPTSSGFTRLTVTSANADIAFVFAGAATGKTVLLDHLVVDAGVSNSDYYTFIPTATATLALTTATPGDGGGQFVNTLDPQIDLYSSTGTLLASNDNGAVDHRNAVVVYQFTAGTTYKIRVSSTNGTSGEYVLRAAPGSAPLPGDANLDGVVDIIDLNRVLTNYDKTGMSWGQGDFDGNGIVDVADMNKVLTNYNKTGAAQPSGTAAGNAGSDRITAIQPAAGTDRQRLIQAAVGMAHDRVLQSAALSGPLGYLAWLDEVAGSQKSKKRDHFAHAVDGILGDQGALN